VTLPPSVSTLPPPSTSPSRTVARNAWAWALAGLSSADRGPAHGAEVMLWRSLLGLLESLERHGATSVTRDAGDAIVTALEGVAPWQRVACARSAWACASRAARRRGTWPRTLAVAGASAYHRQRVGLALAFLEVLHGAELGAELYAAAVTGAEVRA